MTSRLDPLPNVAIDALYAGKPVFCFDKACGISDLFKTNRLLAKELVIPYLNVSVLTEKLAEICVDEDKQRLIGGECKKLAEQMLGMSNYIESLEKMGKQMMQEMKKIDEEVFTRSRDLDRYFCFGRD